MTSDEARVLVTRRNQAVSRHDSAAVITSYARDCVVESPIMGTLIGKDAIRKSFELFWRSFPDVSYEFDDPLISGDRVVQPLTVHGTDTGGVLGESPTGKPFRFFVVILFTLRGREIVYERRVYDFSGLLLLLAGEGRAEDSSATLYHAVLDRALLNQEMKVAAQIQQALLPPNRYSRPGLEIAAASMPCRAIGGDFFDYLDLHNGAFVFTLGDVAGKGPPAALLGGVIQGFLAGQAQLGGTPAETLTHVNQVLLRRTIESRFATVIYGVLSRDGLLTYCNAGHNPPFLLGRRGSIRLHKGGLILGVFNEAAYEEETLRLEDGDVLIAFSDGIPEAVDARGEEFGDRRLLSCVQSHQEFSAAEILDRLMNEVRQFSEGTPQSDDRTALVLRYSS